MSDYRHSFSGIEDLAGRPIKKNWMSFIRNLFYKLLEKQSSSVTIIDKQEETSKWINQPY